MSNNNIDSVETTELSKEEGKSAPDFKEITFFDCSENEESFIECAGAEEDLSASSSHRTESNSTHNTSTTTQEEDGTSIDNSESQCNNFNGL